MAQGFTKNVPLDTDATLAANSDYISPSQKAVKTYIGNTSAPISHITDYNNPHQITINQIGGISSNGWIAGSGTWTCISTDSPIFNVSINNNATGTIGVGSRIWGTQSSNNRYFIVHGVGITGSTTYLNLYGGTDYALVTGAFTSPQYSQVKAPFGFPTDQSKWTVTFTDSTNRTQASPVNGTTYNLGSLSFSFPMGAWKVNLSVMIDALSGAGAGSATHKFALSTANNSFTDTTNVVEVGSYAKAQADNLLETFQSASLDFLLNLITKTTYYTVSKTLDNNMNSITIYNLSIQPLVIRLLCLYL